jgi:adenylylsulfate kinase
MRGSSVHPDGFVVWLTGLPSSGKTTLGRGLEPLLKERGLAVVRLDGDEVRPRLSRELGFSRADREENVRRISFVARKIIEAGGVALVSVIAPYRGLRRECRQEIGRYLEVYVRCPLEICRTRDVKGLYRRAREGQLRQFTGVDDPYEPPLDAEVAVDTANQTVRESLARILIALERQGFLRTSDSSESCRI